MFKRSIATMAVSAALAVLSFGAHAEAPDPATFPVALKNAHNAGGLDVIKQFEAMGGLTGWIVQDKSSGNHVVVYTTADGELLIAGMALDRMGRNMTNLYAEEYVPAPDYTPAYEAFAGENSVAVALGNPDAEAEITVLFDANCSFCKVMHQLVRPAIEAGELRVRYVPVAILGGDSDRKAAALLATDAPMGLVDAYVAGARGELSTDPALLAKVNANTDLMREHGFSGTPAVFYKTVDAGDETIHVVHGVPKVAEMFERLGIDGQLDQLEANPNLTRFLR